MLLYILIKTRYFYLGDYRESKPTASVDLLARLFRFTHNPAQKLFNSRNAFFQKAAPGSHPKEKTPEGVSSFGRLLSMEWNQFEEMALDWLEEVRVVF